jgi:hypothetical protein
MLSDEQGSPGLPVLRDISDAAALPVMQGSLMAANSPGRVLIRLIQVLTGPPRINKRRHCLRYRQLDYCAVLMPNLIVAIPE